MRRYVFVDFYAFTWLVNFWGHALLTCFCHLYRHLFSFQCIDFIKQLLIEEVCFYLPLLYYMSRYLCRNKNCFILTVYLFFLKSKQHKMKVKRESMNNRLRLGQYVPTRCVLCMSIYTVVCTVYVYMYCGVYCVCLYVLAFLRGFSSWYMFWCILLCP